MQIAVLLIAATLGALGANQIGLPLPYLLGSLMASATLSLVYYARTEKRILFPKKARAFFIAVIGTLIGTRFTPELVDLAPLLWPSLLAMLGFILVAEIVGFAIYRYLGRYDLPTALFAAMPGGLIEAVLLGEKAGGNAEILSLQHFARIILVVVTVPILFFLWTGEVVGSAAGETLEGVAVQWIDWALVLGIAGIGLVVSGWIKLPASHLVWPLLIAASLHAVGILTVSGPTTLLNFAQLVVGAGLGCNFAQSTLRRLLKGFALGIIYVLVTLGIGVLFALGLSSVMPLDFETLVVSFAPGGVTEMSLIALSLGVSPLLVAFHHLYRIVMAVFLASYLSKKMDADPSH